MCDWDIEKIEANFEALSSGDLTLIKKIAAKLHTQHRTMIASF